MQHNKTKKEIRHNLKNISRTSRDKGVFSNYVYTKRINCLCSYAPVTYVITQYLCT